MQKRTGGKPAVWLPGRNYRPTACLIPAQGNALGSMPRISHRRLKACLISSHPAKCLASTRGPLFSLFPPVQLDLRYALWFVLLTLVQTCLADTIRITTWNLEPLAGELALTTNQDLIQPAGA